MGYEMINWGSVPDWLVAITAMAAAIFGVYQIRLATRSRHDTLQLARASFLRDVDSDFETIEMVESRQLHVVIRDRITADVKREFPAYDFDDQILEIARRYSTDLSHVWMGNQSSFLPPTANAYMTLMRLPHWCETVGMLCERNLLPVDDVLELYDQMIISTVGNILGHIKKRRVEGPHMNKKYLMYAEKLYEKAIFHKAKANDQEVPNLNRAGLDWNPQKVSG